MLYCSSHSVQSWNLIGYLLQLQLLRRALLRQLRAQLPHSHRPVRLPHRQQPRVGNVEGQAGGRPTRNAAAPVPDGTGSSEGFPGEIKDLDLTWRTE